MCRARIILALRLRCVCLQQISVGARALHGYACVRDVHPMRDASVLQIALHAYLTFVLHLLCIACELRVYCFVDSPALALLLLCVGIELVLRVSFACNAFCARV